MNEQNGHLVASRIEVEPTDRQRAAHKLVEAFGIAGEIDWTAVEANFRVLTETDRVRFSRQRDGKNGGLQSQRVPTCRTGTLPGRPRCRSLRTGANAERQAA